MSQEIYHSDSTFRLKFASQIQTWIQHVVYLSWRSHNENRERRRAGDNPWQSRDSRVCCVDERRVRLHVYVSGGHGFWPRYGCAPAFFLCHDHVHVLAFSGIRPYVSIDRWISRSIAAFGQRWLSKNYQWEIARVIYKFHIYIKIIAIVRLDS